MWCHSFTRAIKDIVEATGINVPAALAGRWQALPWLPAHELPGTHQNLSYWHHCPHWQHATVGKLWMYVDMWGTPSLPNFCQDWQDGLELVQFFMLTRPSVFWGERTLPTWFCSVQLSEFIFPISQKASIELLALVLQVGQPGPGHQGCSVALRLPTWLPQFCTHFRLQHMEWIHYWKCAFFRVISILLAFIFSETALWWDWHVCIRELEAFFSSKEQQISIYSVLKNKDMS